MIRQQMDVAGNQKVVLYSPESVLRSPGLFVLNLIADFWTSRPLAFALARRDISAMYRQSLLGYVWAFLPPLGTTAVFLFLRSGGALATQDAGMSYAVYILTGSLLWQIFADCLNGPLKVMGASRGMLVKINFPRESLLFASFLITCFNMLVRMIILVPALIFFSMRGEYQFELSSLIMFPIGVLGVLMLGYAIGILLTPAGMFYSDVSQGLQMIMTFWMLVSPVVLVPPSSGIIGTISFLNPVSHVLNFARDGLVGNPVDWVPFSIVAILSTMLLAVGLVIFRVSIPHVVARLGM